MSLNKSRGLLLLSLSLLSLHKFRSTVAIDFDINSETDHNDPDNNFEFNIAHPGSILGLCVAKLWFYDAQYLMYNSKFSYTIVTNTTSSIDMITFHQVLYIIVKYWS